MAMRKTLISLFSSKNSSSLICKGKINVSVSLYFSTSVEKEQPFTVYELLTNKHQFSPQVASYVASVLTNFRNPQNSDSLLSFLKEIGFSITQLECIMRHRPLCLIADLEKKIKPKITIFQDMGFSADEITEIISNNPEYLQSSINNRIIPALSVLKGILGSNVEVSKALRKQSRLFTVDLEKNLSPNILFLKSCGVTMEEILKQLCLHPRFFLTKTETMRKYVEKADELGVSRRSKMFFYAVRVVGSMTNETLELKFKAFQELGFSKKDALGVFMNKPIVFIASTEKIRKVKEVLLETGQYDVSCIVNHPTSLTYSVETRYKPRLQVLRILEKKNLIKKWPSLSTLTTLSNKEFCKKFVHPFSNELHDVKLMIVSKPI